MTATRELFAKHNLRCTQQRIALYDALADCTSHPTAEQLYRQVLPRTRRLSLATVYNCLDALTEAGLVRRIPTSNGSCRYDANTATHLHVRYQDTSEVEDVPDELGDQLLERIPPELVAQIEEALGIDVEAVSIHLIARHRPNLDD